MIIARRETPPSVDRLLSGGNALENTERRATLEEITAMGRNSISSAKMMQRDGPDKQANRRIE